MLLLLAGCPGGNNSPPGDPDPSDTCTAILEWAPPTARMDESPLTLEELQKFTVYVNNAEGMEEARITLVIDLTDVYMIQWEIRNLPAGQHWFYMTATALGTVPGQPNPVSGYSNELSKFCT